jgi:hypothetical protein
VPCNPSNNSAFLISMVFFPFRNPGLVSNLVSQMLFALAASLHPDPNAAQQLTIHCNKRPDMDTFVHHNNNEVQSKKNKYKISLESHRKAV